jgi:putative transposase
MTTREITNEYRLTQWAGVIRRRVESGQKIREFCETEGIHENTYYYWQKKLREVAINKIETTKQTMETVPVKTTTPSGWAIYAVNNTNENKEVSSDKEEVLEIEIGKIKIKMKKETDIELMTRVCAALVTI